MSAKDIKSLRQKGNPFIKPNMIPKQYRGSRKLKRDSHFGSHRIGTNRIVPRQQSNNHVVRRRHIPVAPATVSQLQAPITHTNTSTTSSSSTLVQPAINPIISTVETDLPTTESIGGPPPSSQTFDNLLPSLQTAVGADSDHFHQVFKEQSINTGKMEAVDVDFPSNSHVNADEAEIDEEFKFDPLSYEFDGALKTKNTKWDDEELKRLASCIAKVLGNAKYRGLSGKNFYVKVIELMGSDRSWRSAMNKTKDLASSENRTHFLHAIMTQYITQLTNRRTCKAESNSFVM